MTPRQLSSLPTWDPARREPARVPTLRAGDVHVWRVPLGVDANVVRKLHEVLSAKEKERTARFRFERERRRFVVRRGALRELLARYTSVSASCLRFDSEPQGRPVLGRPVGQALQFSLSCSGDLALVAVSRGRKVGVDIERITTEIDIRDMARRFFSPRESTVLFSLSRPTWLKAFFTCWTRKEAYLKARGLGLTAKLDWFDVSFLPGEPAALVEVRGEPDEVARWSLEHLEPKPGYVGTLAVEVTLSGNM